MMHFLWQNGVISSYNFAFECRPMRMMWGWVRKWYFLSAQFWYFDPKAKCFMGVGSIKQIILIFSIISVVSWYGIWAHTYTVLTFLDIFTSLFKLFFLRNEILEMCTDNFCGDERPQNSEIIDTTEKELFKDFLILDYLINWSGNFIVFAEVASYKNT